MGMHWEGYHGEGLVLTEEEFGKFLMDYKRRCEDKDSVRQVEKMEDGDIGVNEVVFISPSGMKFKMFCADDSCVEGFRLTPYRIRGKANDNWITNDTIPSYNVYVISSDKVIEGMHCFEEKAYESYEAFVDEFKDKLETYLPEDFDWDAHIGIYRYACLA